VLVTYQEHATSIWVKVSRMRLQLGDTKTDIILSYQAFTVVSLKLQVFWNVKLCC